MDEKWKQESCDPHTFALFELFDGNQFIGFLPQANDVNT
jgi:hypothetical protein